MIHEIAHGVAPARKRARAPRRPPLGNHLPTCGLRAFPIVFLLVAVLMSLTTMTRMVEEDRGLIGTYLG